MRSRRAAARRARPQHRARRRRRRPRNAPPFPSRGRRRRFPVSTSPEPAVASAGVPYVATSTPSRGVATIVSAPFRSTTEPKRDAARRAASSRCASISRLSTPSRRASSPLWGVSTVGAARANGSSCHSASASSTSGSSSRSRRMRTSSTVPSLRPRPGPIATASDFSAAARIASIDRGSSRPEESSGSGRLTTSSSVVSSTGRVDSGAATAT